MKFILNESNKFLLEERFILAEETILTEATVAEAAEAWNVYLKKSIENSSKTLEMFLKEVRLSKKKLKTKAEWQQILNQINSTKEELENSLDLPFETLAANLEKVKEETKNYLNALNVPLEDGSDEKTSLDAWIKQINPLLTKLSWDKKDIEKIQEILVKVEKQILPKFDLSEIQQREQQIEQFKEICNNCQQLAPKILEFLPEKFIDVDDLKLKKYVKLMTKFKANDTLDLITIDRLNDGVIIMNVAVYLKRVTTLQEAYKELLELEIFKEAEAQKEQKRLDQEKKEKEEQERLEKERLEREEREEQERLEQEEREYQERRAKETDWDKLYKQCESKKDFENFWHGTVKDNPTNDLEKGYWRATWGEHAKAVEDIGMVFRQGIDVYGFSPELNPLIEFFQKIIDQIPPTNIKSSYIALHNLVAERNIDDAELSDPSKSIFGNSNIIWNKNLFKLSSKEIQELGELQLQVFNQDVVQKMSSEEQQVLWKKLSLNSNGEFEDISTIKKNIKRKFGNTAKVLPKADNTTITKLVDSITSTTEAKKVLAYLVDNFRKSSTKILGEIQKQTNNQLFIIRDQTKLSYEDMLKYDKKFNMEFEPRFVKTLLIEVAKKAGLISTNA